MFKSARIKLTLLYLLILMSISFLFSVSIYRLQGAEFERVLQQQRDEIQRRGFVLERLFPVDPEQTLIQEARNRLIFNLFLTNLVIFVVAGGTGYYLSGKTLEPIEEMMNEQNRFVADASHELRTPITAMKTQTEVSLRDKNFNLNDAKEILTSNLEELDNLSELSDYLLNLAKYETNEKTDFEKVDLSEIARIAIKKVGPQAKNREIKIESNIAETKIKGDKDSLIKLFVIFLENAIKYSPEKNLVKIEAINKPAETKIVFEDKGYGIAKEDLPKIFNRFYRSDQARTKTKASGFGLGLSLADQIVKLHKGTLDVESEVDKGSKFIVTLPKETP